MKVTFWGAARTVTGSMHLMETAHKQRVLLDCGLFQGSRKKAEEINRNIPFEPPSLLALVLSHAHIDHSGLIPLLSKKGFAGPIYATPATVDLCRIMLADSAHIQVSDARWINKKREKNGEEEIQPLYLPEDVERAMKQFVAVDYGDLFSPIEGMEVEFRDAGHILGSATVNISVREKDRTIRLGFTGDVGRPDRPIIRDPQPMQDCEYLISESTYGGETHEPIQDATKRLEQVIGRTIERGGKVIIPAFSVGRTQEIVYALDQLWKEERLPVIPIFVDSPLAVNATDVYRAHPECFDAQMHEFMLSDANPFGFERLTYVRDVEQSKALNSRHDPMVIISASGMCEGGRILHHLRNNIEDPRNTVLMVGFSAQHTLGARIAERRPEVRIFGIEHALKAEVVRMDSYSAHADQPELLQFHSHLDRERLKQVFLVHGNLDRQEILKEAMESEGYPNVTIPDRGDSAHL